MTRVPVAKIPCTCLHCGKSFEVFPSRVKYGEGKYCSGECSGLAHRKTTPMDKVIIKEFLCKNCGKVFTKRNLWTGKEPQYCSRKCYRPIMSDNTHFARNCVQCGKPFVSKGQGWRQAQNRKYCSRQCYALAHRGEGNCMWKGGHRDYRGENWREQRNFARLRDGNICQICHRKQRKSEPAFVIHHIKPFRQFNGDYLAANDLSNLITLCQQCHPRAECGKIAVPKRLL